MKTVADQFAETPDMAGVGTVLQKDGSSENFVAWRLAGASARGDRDETRTGRYARPCVLCH